MRKSTVLILPILLITFNSCNEEHEIEPISINRLAETTIQISDSDWQNNIVNVDTANYTFKFSKDILDNHSINKGDILLGSEDGGYLRKVKNMITVGDEIIIETEFATITEAFEELHEQSSVSIVPNIKSQEFWLEDGVEMTSLKKGTSANLMNFTINSVLFDLDNKLSTTKDQVRISGSYTLDANFYINIDIEDFEVSKLMFQYVIDQTKVINGYLGIGGLDYSNKRKLATIPCGVIPAGPVIIEPIIDIYAGFAMNLTSSLEMKIEQGYISSTTINFQDGNWNTEKSVVKNEIFEKPSISGVLNAKLYLKPVIRFRVYRTVSPYIDAELYGAANVELESDLLKWKTSVGFDMNAGINMMIWNHSLFDFHTKLFNIEDVIAQGEENYNNQIKNVALSENGAVATAISEGSYNGTTHYAYFSNDGEKNSFWASQWDMPSWLRVEFDQIYSIESVGVWWGSHKHNFTISLSLDGENWTQVYSGTSNNSEGAPPIHEEFPINKTNAKFLKIDITSTSAPTSHIFQSIVNEIEAYGKIE